MNKTILLISVAISLAYSVYVPLPYGFGDFCILDNGTNLYNNQNNPNTVPTFQINLDDDPSERWNQIGQVYGKNIDMLINNLTHWLIPLMDKFNITNGYDIAMIAMELLVLPQIPEPYNSEIVGMSKASGLRLGKIVMYNIFYEIFTVCTSIVANDDQGNIYHARNLDFGLLMGWDPNTHDWAITENLRQMIFNLEWTRGGKTMFHSVQFAGYVGVLSGFKTGAFGVTVNDRFMADGGIVGILDWLLPPLGKGNRQRKWTTWITREALEDDTIMSFENATTYLSAAEIMAPVYYTISGANPWEGAILARSLNYTDIKSVFNQSDPVEGWYLLQTNYDQGVEVLYLDDRRTPGHICMKKLGQANVGYQGLFNVLTSKTNLNMLTAYTTLFSAQTGHIETYVAYCPHPCYAW